jgi:hypothetical protein
VDLVREEEKGEAGSDRAVQQVRDAWPTGKEVSSLQIARTVNGQWYCKFGLVQFYREQASRCAQGTELDEGVSRE